MCKFDWISVYIYWVLCRQEVEVSGNGNQFWSSLFPIAFPFPTKHRDPWQFFFRKTGDSVTNFYGNYYDWDYIGLCGNSPKVVTKIEVWKLTFHGLPLIVFLLFIVSHHVFFVYNLCTERQLSIFVTKPKY